MSKRTIGTVCTGIDGIGVGARDAGLELAWGIEIDPRLAAVANFNLGQHVMVANLLDCDPMDFERVDVLHASPPCPNFSVAKAGGVETALDLALARKVAEFVTVLQPGVFTLENVFAYRNSKSWRLIENALYGAGYWLHIDHVNAADMGVPQTRKRMIVRAVRGGFVPYLPRPVKWNSWYSAIEDLIPGLPDSQFADRQLLRLPEELRTMLITDQYDKPSNCDDRKAQQIDIDKPSATVTSSNRGDWRAFIVEGSVAGEDNRFTMPVRMDDEPVFTMRAVQNNPRAFIVSSTEMRNETFRTGPEPVFTLKAQDRSPRAYVPPGRVVSMTPRCLARFQSFPDWFQLSGNKTLDSRGIGNAVPPLLMKAILEGLSI